MPDSYLFELVLQSRDEASPTVEKLRAELAALQGTLQKVGTQAETTGTTQTKAVQAAAAATRQATQEQSGAFTALGGVANQVTQGIVQGFGINIGLSVASATASVVRFAAESVNSFAEYDKAIREINTITGSFGEAGQAQFQQLNDQVRDFAVRMGVDARGAAEGLYQTISAGIPKGAEAFKVLEASTKLAVAGMTTTDVATKAVTASLNSYHLGADQASHVSDILFTAVQNGRLRMDELANSLGRVVPVAAANGVSLQEVTSAMAVMTAQGASAETAATNVAAAISAFDNPGKQATATAAKYGIELDATALKQKSLAGAMQDAYDKTNGNIEALAKLFPNIRGLRGELQLGADDFLRLAQNEQGAATNAGVVDQAFQEVNRSGARQFEELAAKSNELKLRIGELLAGPASGLVDFISQLGAKLGAWPADAPPKEQADRFSALGAAADIAAEAIKGLIHWQQIQAAITMGKEAAAGIEALVAPNQQATAAAQAHIAAVQELEQKLAHGAITTQQYKDGLAALAQAEQQAAHGSADSVDVEDRRAAAMSALTARLNTAKAATDQHTAAVVAQTDAERNYQEILGNIQKAQDAGIYTEKQADDARARALADRDKALSAAADSQRESNQEIAEQSRLAASGALSYDAWAKSLLNTKTELKGLTESGFKEKLKEIADAEAFGAIGHDDAIQQIKDVTAAYQRSLDEQATAAKQAADKVAAEQKRSSEEVATALRQEEEDYARFGQAVVKDRRDALQQIATIQQTHDDAMAQAAKDSDAKITEANKAEIEGELAEQRHFLQDFGKLVAQRTQIEQGQDDATTERNIRLSRQTQDRVRTEKEAEARANNERVANRTAANEKLAEIDRKYGRNGEGGQEAIADQKERDQAVAEAKITLDDRVAQAEAHLSEQNHDADQQRDQAVADARTKRAEADAQAQVKRDQDIASARQKLDDALAAAEQQRLQGVADAFTQEASRTTDEAQRLLDQLTSATNKPAQDNRAQQQAAEAAAYEQRLTDEAAQHTKAIHEAQSILDLEAERKRHDEAEKHLLAEHETAQAGGPTPETGPDPQAKLKADAAKEQADYERRLGEELTLHEGNRSAALTDEQKADERSRHEDAQRLLEKEHADRLKQLALESGLLTDEQKKEADAQFALIDREHRQRLSDLQDEADARKKTADDTLAAALKQSALVYEDTLKKNALAFKDTQDKAERAHQDALDKAKREHDDALAKANDAFKDTQKKQADLHTDALVKIAERYATERDAALKEQNARFKDIDDREEKDKKARSAAYDLQDTREQEDFTRRQNNTLEHLKSEMTALQQRHEQELTNIAARRDKDIEAANDALTKKQEAINTQRATDFSKFDQDLKDRFADLQTQFEDAMGKLAANIPDKVQRVLSGAQATVAGAVANVEGAIPSGATFRPGGKPGETQSEAFNFLVNTGTSPEQAAKIVGRGAGETGEAPSLPIADNDAWAQLLSGFNETLAAVHADYAKAQALADDEVKRAIAAGTIGGDALSVSGHPVRTSTPSGTFDAGGALAWAMDRVGQAIYEGYCERFVENAFNTGGRFASAAAAAQAMQTHPGGSLQDAPRGALVFFRPDNSNGGYGHVGISTGGGRFVSALYTGVAVQGSSPEWNRLYSGWGEPTFRAFGGPGEAGKPYLVGERTGSPEVYVPEQPGQFHADLSSIFDYDRLAGAIAQAMARVLPAQAPTPMRAPITINANGSDPRAVVREVTRQQRRQDLLDRAMLQGVA